MGPSATPGTAGGAYEWLSVAVPQVPATCSNCGDATAKEAVLREHWPAADGVATALLLRCGNCGCGFVHPAPSADYAGEPAGGSAALAFYLQQGANLRGIAANLASLGRPPGTRLLEVGCGFGFGLDFARRSLGWTVLGLDPSPFAVAGRVALGVPIETRYLETDAPDMQERFDVVMASEVIEHVPSPPIFLKTLRQALCPGGALVLTTPDVDAARPTTPPGLLVPLLSVGFHLVLQSASSLAFLLRGEGFSDILVRRSGPASLLARASRPGAVHAVPNAPPGGFDVLLRAYLDEAADAAPAQSDLWFGLIARLYREAVQAGDNAQADAAWRRFREGCQQRFRIEPEAAPDAVATSLEALAAAEPLCLGPVLLHRAFQLIQDGATRRSVTPLIEGAARACARLRRALSSIGTDDGDAEDIAWAAEAELALGAAESGDPAVLDQLAALASAAGSLPGRRERAASVRRRAFVILVNAGHLELAGALEDVVSEAERRAAGLSMQLLADDELDVLYCAATRELQRPGGSAERALAQLTALRRLAAAARTAGRTDGSAVHLEAPAVAAAALALENLGRADEAAALRSASPIGKG